MRRQLVEATLQLRALQSPALRSLPTRTPHDQPTEHSLTAVPAERLSKRRPRSLAASLVAFVSSHHQVTAI